ncbi:MAG: hypothetical protein A2452_13410 [Candidatus Firestonebacteria bacterium RIFOXYC2_FULL_39_67]|nr:MAG: hypothetical protein A2536_05260 [Candidatus Firestonebacteria bacterium RIFOXYD2_FULL_39_29]OGF56204.1 MAG: hypothetical protein A2452_13410 [Candidatus Firestonebacteria bacterium RIFOXYC2_FULL_39_67]
MKMSKLLISGLVLFLTVSGYSQTQDLKQELLNKGLVSKTDIEKALKDPNNKEAGETQVVLPSKEEKKPEIEVPSVIEELFIREVKEKHDDYIETGKESKEGEAGEVKEADTEKEKKFLKQFGYNIFKAASTTFAPTDNVPVGPDYIVGPGDNFVVYVWGKLVQETFSLTVDRDGKISLPKAGAVFLWGMKFGEAEKLIKDALSQNYANFSINVTMGKLRTIRIFVLGEVKKPGGYTISSLSTLFHSLYEAGGPTKVGSLRKVKLIRDNKVVSTIDLYDFLLVGEKGLDVKLQSNDTVFVPSIGAVAGVTGNIKKPGIYELAGETKLSALMKMVGGVTPSGYVSRIQIERTINGERKAVLDVELKTGDALKDGKDIIVNDGDLITVFPINKLKYNYVTLYGNVGRPAEYELTPGLKVKELIEKAGGILPGTYLNRAEISRYKNDKAREIVAFDPDKLLKGDVKENQALKEWDEVTVYSQSEILPVQYVEISGAVNKEGRFELAEKMKVSDLIFKAKGLKKTASMDSAELFKIVFGKQPEIKKINLKKLLVEGVFDEDYILEAGDHLFIREETSWTKKKKITLSGEVKFPGVYVADSNEKLSSVLERAGGYSEKASPKSAVFTRESVKTIQQKTMLKYMQRLQQEVAAEGAKLAATGQTDADTKKAAETVKRKEDLVKVLGSIDVPGRLIIKLEDLKAFKDSKDDIIIEDGDSLYIPQIPSTVNVIGSVYNPTSIVYEPERNIHFYLDRVGGTTKDADRGDVYIVRASGEVDKNNAWGKNIERGDTIIVPAELKTETNWLKVLTDTSTIFFNAAVGVSAINR